MEPEIKPNCLPTEKSLNLLMDHAWPVVAQIAGTLIGNLTYDLEDVKKAVRKAREIVAVARESFASDITRQERRFEINGIVHDNGELAARLTTNDSSRIGRLEVGDSLTLRTGVVVRRTQ